MIEQSDIPQRILNKLVRCEVTGCLVWVGALDRDGYGVLYGEDGKTHRAHRYVYAKLVGPIPKQHTLDHLLADRPIKPGSCVFGPACCEPDHLEPVLVKVNAGRVRNWNSAKLCCPRGHAYDESNTIHYRGRRYCRICQNVRRANRQKRKKSGGQA